MKIEKTLKKGLLVLASAALMGMTLFAGETKTYPKDGKGDQILGYKNLENSYGISTSFEGNIFHNFFCCISFIHCIKMYSPDSI